MDRRGRARAELEVRGAGRVDHPGGDLLSHLVRTQELLDTWGARPALAVAGLCHAAYGTDGFGVQLYGLDERAALADLIGPEAEHIVYQYASCDRRFVYPQLGGPTVSFRDRFTGGVAELGRSHLADFAELTFANELDLVSYSPEFGAANGAGIAAALRPARGLVSTPAWASFCRLLGADTAQVSR